MSFNKSDISLNIAKKTSISHFKSKQLLDKFFQVVVFESYKKKVKINGFGTFKRENTPERAGRNPRTKEEYIIPKMNKLRLIASNIIKLKIN